MMDFVDFLRRLKGGGLELVDIPQPQEVREDEPPLGGFDSRLQRPPRTPPRPVQLLHTQENEEGARSGRFITYGHVIECMGVKHPILVGRYGNFQFIYPWTEETYWHRDPERIIKLSPKRWKIPWSGEVANEEVNEHEASRRWRERIPLIKLLEALGYDIDYKAIRGIFDLNPSYSYYIKQQPDLIPRDQIERALTVLELDGYSN